MTIDPTVRPVIVRVRVGRGKAVHKGMQGVTNLGTPYLRTVCGSELRTKYPSPVRLAPGQSLTCRRCFEGSWGNAR